jgi:hypothetical protein
MDKKILIQQMAHLLSSFYESRETRQLTIKERIELREQLREDAKKHVTQFLNSLEVEV